MGPRSAPAPAVLAAALLLLFGCSRPVPEPTRPNVLLVVIDTLRADRLSSYGYARNTTPNLDAFAREGMLFERAYAPTPKTVSSHATLFTSTHPATHGAWNSVPLGDGSEVIPRLSPNAVTLAEVLRDHGYQTAAIADGGWLRTNRGLAQGFEDFDSRHTGVVDRVDRALEWLDERSESSPFFLFLHTYQVHTPYLPPVGYEDRFAGDYEGPLRQALAEARAAAAEPGLENPLVDIHVRFFKPLQGRHSPEDRRFLSDLYDAELSLVDEQFARLLAFLRVGGLLDDTLVVVTSDHGEEFAEHGRYGHRQVYEALLRVPLLVRAPGIPRGARRSDVVRLVDVMPSLLQFVGLEPPPAAVGRPIDFRSETGQPGELTVVAESNALETQAAVRRGGLKAVFHEAMPSRAEVFRPESDPGERTDLAATPEGAAFLDEARRALAAHRERARRHRQAHGLEPVRGDRSALEPREIQALQALGYLDPAPPAPPAPRSH